MNSEFAEIAGEASYEFLKSAFKDGFEWFTQKATAKLSLKTSLKSYITCYERRHGTIKVLGMPSPRDIRSIYTAVQVATPQFLSRLATTESMEIAYRSKGDRSLFPAHHGAKDGVAIANSEQCLNVLGAPGSGKSTFLRRLGIASLEALADDNQQKSFTHKLIPIFISLNEYDPKTTSLYQQCLYELGIGGFDSNPNQFLADGLEKGIFLILCDGLDEVDKGNIEGYVKAIREFIHKYPLNRYVTSCRTAFYRNQFKDFHDVVIADFDDNQIKHFISNWFVDGIDAEKRVGDKLIKLLFARQNRGTLELACNPLLLTFICLVYDASQSLPSNRASLYERALRILMEGWSAEKRIHSSKVCNLSSDFELEILSDIAGVSFQRNKLFFERSELLQHFDRYLSNQVIKPSGLESAEVLRAIELQQGLLVERASEIFSFSHLTIQEYLAARWYSRSTESTILLIDSYSTDERWREVFLLLFGMGKADEYLSRIFARHTTTKSELTDFGAKILEWNSRFTLAQGSGEDRFAGRIKTLLFISSIALARARSAQLAIQSAKSSNILSISRATHIELKRAEQKIERINRNLSKLLDEICQTLSDCNLFHDAEYFIDRCQAISWDGDYLLCQMLDWEYPEESDLYSGDSDDLIATSDVETITIDGDPELYFENEASWDAWKEDLGSFLLEAMQQGMIGSQEVDRTMREIDELELPNSRLGLSIWFLLEDNLGISEELFDAINENSETLSKLTAECRRILECKASSLSLSKATWNEIVDGLLAPRSS